MESHWRQLTKDGAHFSMPDLQPLLEAAHSALTAAHEAHAAAADAAAAAHAANANADTAHHRIDALPPPAAPYVAPVIDIPHVDLSPVHDKIRAIEQVMTEVLKKGVFDRKEVADTAAAAAAVAAAEARARANHTDATLDSAIGTLHDRIDAVVTHVNKLPAPAAPAPPVLTVIPTQPMPRLWPIYVIVIVLAAAQVYLHLK